MSTPQKRSIQLSVSNALEHWVLLSFAGSLLLGLFVWWKFGVSYFEDAHNIQIKKNLAAFHRALGDELLMHAQDWEAAKAQVFQPLENQKFPKPEVVNAKLNLLVKLFPKDPQVYYLRGIYYLGLSDTATALRWLLLSVEKDSRFSAGYVALGVVYQREHDLPAAIRAYEEAVRQAPDSPWALNNLGFLYLLTEQFPQAIEQLRTAYIQAPFLLTALNLADAYRYSGRFEEARALNQALIDAMDDEELPLKNKAYAQGDWTYSYMPVTPGDRATSASYYIVARWSEKRALAYYSLSISHALLGDTATADKHFEQARQLSQSEGFRRFIQNKLESTVGLTNPPAEVRPWFTEHQRMLSGGPSAPQPDKDDAPKSP